MPGSTQLLVLILNKEEYLEDILSLYLEMNIQGATILDSVGMGRIITHDIPLFAGFRDLMAGNRPYNKTILSVVNEDIIPDVVRGVKEICSVRKEAGIGLMFSLPVSGVYKLSGE